jgi:ribosomal protein S18 acetylase RimI-like enzyme
VPCEFPAGYDGSAILERLAQVLDLELDESILDLGFVRSLELRFGHTSVTLRLPTSCRLRPLGASGCCEIKRLYLVPEARGSGLGKALVDALVAVAEAIGYREMRLDTLLSMVGAQALYRKLGFVVIEPYYDTPVGGTLFMRRCFRATGSRINLEICSRGKVS